jgi:hypothetical protein
VGWSPYWIHSARRPLLAYFTTPRVIVMMENLVEWRLAGETEVLRGNLPQRHFVHHKSLLPDPGSNPGRRGGKPATNRLSYGAACVLFLDWEIGFTLFQAVCKIIVFYILMLSFLERKREVKNSKLNGKKDSLKWICLWRLGECNFNLYLSFPDISTSPHFGRLY